MSNAFKRFQWRSFEPADEREGALFDRAYRLSYRALVVLITMSPIVFQYAYNTLSTRTEASIASFMYVILGFILAEWIGGQVFVNQDVQFAKGTYIRWYSKDERSGLGWVILFGIVSIFTITAYYFITVPKI